MLFTFPAYGHLQPPTLTSFHSPSMPTKLKQGNIDMRRLNSSNSFMDIFMIASPHLSVTDCLLRARHRLTRSLVNRRACNELTHFPIWFTSDVTPAKRDVTRPSLTGFFDDVAFFEFCDGSVILSERALKNLAGAIRKMPTRRYVDYIRSKQWARVRTEHLERCGHRCEICHTGKACQVHHWTYVRLGFEHPLDLCAVCVSCHHRLHCSLVPANDNQLSFTFTRAGSA
jgi:hypothetical protein